ncbi:hypothetical protein [Paracraurococcus ruber]|uniref:Uncharacterized protein n=1 Tax=Paracraurococcus ruber TaxID=77675 RepID=A0ABS1CYG0_9PROT|nr:hypothetical protein [Paracraurococcus ruber]MBK1659573.1 hypothetical protein [Paracraurococcus ruber]TDG32325.1 hypothetical protein E2C05_07795 [Paracraurococcus ruber]
MATRTRKTSGKRRSYAPAWGTGSRTSSVRPGSRIGLLRVEHEGEPYEWRGQFSRRRWVCRCDCGNLTEVREDRLRLATTRSCGCVRTSVARERLLKHGGRANGRAAPEYWAWQAMLHRMEDVRVCRRWRAGKGQGFAAFLEDVGPRPSERHRLVRPDPSRAFGPDNAEWQADVPRRGVPRRLVAWRGRQMTLHEAAERAGVPYARLCKRLERGWPVAEALRS